MRKIKILFISLFWVCMVSGCEKQEQSINLSSIDISDIKKIEHRGTTGGKDGSYSYCLSHREGTDLINLLHQVELGNTVDASKALSAGAVSYYTLYFTDGKKLSFSPGQYFKIENAYYDFKNYDELWDEFIRINSIN